MKSETGYNQLKAIIGEILEFQEYPEWSFINGVLDCKAVLGDYCLWFHWGKLRIVPIERRFEQGLNAGMLEVLEDWNTEKDGTITLIGRKE